MSPSDRLRRRVLLAGTVHTAALLSLTVMSFPLTAFVPFGELQSRERATVERLLAPVARVAPSATRWVSDQFVAGSTFSRRSVQVATYVLPLLVATLMGGAVLWWMARDAAAVDAAVVRTLAAMAVAFAIVSIPALPVFTHDFWLSIAWGRMLAAGDNPYYQPFSAAGLREMPFTPFALRMTYGPLWGLLSAALARLCDYHLILEFVVFKLAHACFWLATLWVVLRLLADAAPLPRAVALCIYAWLPASVHLTVAEGHNDIAMIFFLALWLLFARRQRLHLTILPLAASALCKYVTAPLLLADVLSARAGARAPWPTILVNLAGGALLTVTVFAFVWQGPALFDAATGMRSWIFLTPADALATLLGWMRVPLPYAVAAAAFRILFWALAIRGLVRLARGPSPARLVEASLAIMAAVVFTVVGHVWPWFFMWILVPLAVAPHGGLARFLLPCVILCPFVHVYWLTAPGWSRLPVASVIFYGAVTAAALCWPRTPFARLTEAHR